MTTIRTDEDEPIGVYIEGGVRGLIPAVRDAFVVVANEDGVGVLSVPVIAWSTNGYPWVAGRQSLEPAHEMYGPNFRIEIP